MDYKTELDTIEHKVNSNKLEQARLGERKKKLEEEKGEILNQLKEEGITEEELQDKISELEIEIQESIEKCQEVLK